jgi:mitochondrial intermembrane space import and assembly protein 40
LTPSARFKPPHPEDKPTIPATPSSSSPPSIDPKAPLPTSDEPVTSPEGLEQEAASQGAFNEETGEINWDCPCLGGMANGPCGEEFREAFSCFVFSKEEPKGMDCIEKFKGMQTCFRKYPEIYGAELDDEEEDEAALSAGALPEDGPTMAASQGITAELKNEAPESNHLSAESQKTDKEAKPTPEKKSIYDSEDERNSSSNTSDQGSEKTKELPGQNSLSKGSKEHEEDELVPKAAHDAKPADS